MAVSRTVNQYCIKAITLQCACSLDLFPSAVEPYSMSHSYNLHCHVFTHVAYVDKMRKCTCMYITNCKLQRYHFALSAKVNSICFDLVTSLKLTS